MGKLFKKVSALCLMSLLAAACQTVNPNFPSTAMPAGNAQVGPPSGFIGFCIRNPEQCETQEGVDNIVPLTSENWATLSDVNYRINRAISYKSDADHYGRPEYWEISTDGLGDCDEFVLTKRKHLIDAGLPANALRITIVRTEQNIGHTVLMVTTDRGDYVLDNRTSRVLPWTNSGYEWISRQNGQGAMSWVSLRDETYLVASR